MGPFGRYPPAGSSRHDGGLPETKGLVCPCLVNVEFESSEVGPGRVHVQFAHPLSVSQCVCPFLWSPTSIQCVLAQSVPSPLAHTPKSTRPWTGHLSSSLAGLWVCQPPNSFYPRSSLLLVHYHHPRPSFFNHRHHRLPPSYLQPPDSFPPCLALIKRQRPGRVQSLCKALYFAFASLIFFFFSLSGFPRPLGTRAA